jgi:hypothetical protein
MLKRFLRLAFLACPATLLMTASITIGADKIDFSGSYTLTASKGALKLRGKVWTLKVKQTESAIEVTRVMDGHQNVNNVPLDGSTGVYVSPGGPTGTCKAQLKAKSLVLETLLVSRPQPSGPVVRLHTKERWELSSDSKTLTIRSEIDSPQSLLEGIQIVEPWSEIYTRN